MWTYIEDDNDLTMNIVSRLIGSWFTSQDVSRWWLRSNRHLNGRSPLSAWAEGDHRKVYDLAYSGQQTSV